MVCPLTTVPELICAAIMKSFLIHPPIPIPIPIPNPVYPPVGYMVFFHQCLIKDLQEVMDPRVHPTPPLTGLRVHEKQKDFFDSDFFFLLDLSFAASLFSSSIRFTAASPLQPSNLLFIEFKFSLTSLKYPSQLVHCASHRPDGLTSVSFGPRASFARSPSIS